MAKDLKFQRKQLKKLRSGKKHAYEEASVYTILLDLVEGNGWSDVCNMLQSVASDLGEKQELDAEFDRAKNFDWS